MNTIKETVKKVTKTISENEKVKEITNKVKESGAVDSVINVFKDDPYYDIKKEILKQIKQYNTIIIHRHVSPDGDCLGSAYGLREILRLTYPEKKIYSVGSDSIDYLKFLGSDDIIDDDVYADALVIVVDTSNEARISDKRYKNGKYIIKIDHHIEVEKYGDLNYVREEMPSTATIITDFFSTFQNELKLNEQGAMYLYLGTVTDTGRFRYSSVTGETLRLAGKLLDYHFDTERMFSNLQIKNKDAFKLLGYVYNHFKVSENGVAYIFMSKRIQKKFHVSSSNAAALVNSMDSVRGSLIWILFVEYEDVIRARLRSRYIGVVDIANQFEGGGHLQASGAVCRSKKDIKRMVAMADANLKKFKDEHKDLF